MTDTTEKNYVPSPLLVSILRTKRADGTPGDNQFRLWLLNYLKSFNHEVIIAARGNLICKVGTETSTLFSCHIDTCHSKAESDGTKQDLVVDNVMGHICLPRDTTSACLGADDGVGIYLMLEMIKANVPGVYVFHTGEEVGGKGARALLDERPQWLKSFKRAVAFDRPGNDEVIITQGGMSCASPEAGKYLAAELSKHNLTYQISTKGVFTDTKVYAGLIAECFNIGVGYQFQHSVDEYLDLDHVENLLEAVLSIDWEKIPTVRTLPTAVFTPKPVPVPPKPIIRFPTVFEEIGSYSLEELAEVCENTPEEAARIILRLFASLKGKEEEINTIYDKLGVL